jgi:hypothetical protein
MTLKKNEFIEFNESNQGTAISFPQIIGARHLSNVIKACILFLADLVHYDRFCHKSRGIHRIHTRSWILLSTSSLDRLFLQSGELLIANPAQGKTTSGGEHQLEITLTQEWAMGSTTQPTNGKSTF